MCIVCADMSGQFRRTDFLSEDLGSDLAVGAGQRGLNYSPNSPLAFFDLDDRGGTAGNGKPSLTPTDAGTQITRANARWSTNIGDPATVTYAFRSNAPTSMPSDTSGFSRFSEAQIAATELMLLAWSDVARITFNRVGTGSSGEGAYSDSAAMLFGNYSAGADGAAAFAYYPGNTNSAASSGDVWINSSLSYNATPLYLAYGYQVLVHEIGHAIGLGHPADYNAGSGGPITYSGSATYYEDTRQYTVMSYFGESNTGGNFGGRYSSAPLLDDIAAAQRLYGANMTTRAGDTVYGFNSTADRVWFNAGTSGSPQAVIFAVWDAGGTDTLDFSGYTQAGIIDLRQGHFSSVGGLVGNVSIAMGAVIENAIGGSGADVLVGNSANNRLTGGTGNDNLYGGAGSDTAVFSGNMSAYTITAGTETINGIAYRIVTVVGPDGTDVLRGIENLQFADQTIAAPVANAGVIIEGDATNDTLTGTDYADHLIGADGNDTIDGGAGNDEINGGRGNDNLTGGLGFDWVDYSNATGGVTVNLTNGTATGAAGNDSLAGFEAIRGSTFNDTLTGNAAGEIIDGMGGSDTLNGEGGNDQLYARDGILVAAADVIKPNTQSNLSIGTAVNVDANFDQLNDPGVQNATTVPHAVIRGTGTGGGQEYYAFTVTAGAACIFDIASAGFDTTLRIFDASGTQLAWNDDEASGNTASLINYTFATAGTYYVAVGAWQSGASEAGGSAPVPYNGTYVLNVSIPGHSYVEATGVGSTLNGGDGDDELFSGGSNDTINGGDGTDTVVLWGARSTWTITHNGGSNFTVTNGSQTDTLSGVEFARFTDGTYALNTNTPSPGDDTLTGTEDDDIINGLGGNDTIYGLGGNDWLEGGMGNDRLFGGAGNDLYIIENVGDEAIETTAGSAGGRDAVRAYVDFTLGANIEVLDLQAGTVAVGNDLDNDILGNAGNNWLEGRGGRDRLFGGAGNDLYIIENVGDEAIETTAGSAGGRDAVRAYVDFTLGANIEVLDLQAGTVAVGNDLDNDILGNAGNNWLEGRGGLDRLFGGAGDDLYIIENVGDEAIETIAGSAGGRDAVRAYVDFTLGANIEVLDLQAGTVAVGNDLDNDILGNAGNNWLEGRGGRDRLFGGAGNDLYIIENVGDEAIETTAGSAGGRDAVRAYVDFTLGANIEVLDLQAGTVAVGNDLDNDILGNAGNNWLEGRGGRDRLFGGAGNDLYIIENVGDEAIETTAGSAGGRDAVRAYVDFTLGANIEVLDLQAGTVAVGNDLDNDILGNAGANILNGAGGNDRLFGGAGDDTLSGGAGNDLFVIQLGGGNDTITDWGSGDTLYFAELTAVGVTYTSTQIGADTLLQFSNGQSVRILNTSAGSFAPAEGANYIVASTAGKGVIALGDSPLILPDTINTSSFKSETPQTLPGTDDFWSQPHVVEICPVDIDAPDLLTSDSGYHMRPHIIGYHSQSSDFDYIV